MGRGSAGDGGKAGLYWRRDSSRRRPRPVTTTKARSAMGHRITGRASRGRIINDDGRDTLCGDRFVGLSLLECLCLGRDSAHSRDRVPTFLSPVLMMI